jgi:hypothetical protein
MNFPWSLKLGGNYCTKTLPGAPDVSPFKLPTAIILLHILNEHVNEYTGLIKPE